MVLLKRLIMDCIHLNLLLFAVGAQGSDGCEGGPGCGQELLIRNGDRAAAQAAGEDLHLAQVSFVLFEG